MHELERVTHKDGITREVSEPDLKIDGIHATKELVSMKENLKR